MKVLQDLDFRDHKGQKREISEASGEQTMQVECCTCFEYQPSEKPVHKGYAHDYYKSHPAGLFERSTRNEQLSPLDAATRRCLSWKRGPSCRQILRSCSMTILSHSPRRIADCANQTCSTFVKPRIRQRRYCQLSECLAQNLHNLQEPRSRRRLSQ